MQLQGHMTERISLSQDCANRILVAFGANLPYGAQSPQETIHHAIKGLAKLGLPADRVSRLYRTPSFPAGSGPDYVNAAASIKLRQKLSGEAILSVVHAVETEYGRARQHRWAGRTLDIDLVAVDDSVLPDPQVQTWWRDLNFRDQIRLAPDRLILPHPRMQDRSFVLVPLADVAPDWVHPLLGLTVTQMLANRPDAERASVTPISDGAD